MSTIVACECGAKVRLPENSDGSFRCPKCKNTFAVTADAKVITARPAQATGSTCPICQTDIQASEPVFTCPSCDQIHHQACWSEVGGCATYGCKQAPALEKEAPEQPLTAWGDTKKCPACGETIKSIALRCRYCQTEFDTVNPLTLKDLRHQVRTSEKVKGMQGQMVAIFALSIIGCLAPIMLLVSLGMVLPRKKELAKAGPVYQIMGYSAIGLSVLYSFLLLVFYAFS